MNVYGIDVTVKNSPVLDKGFIPMAAYTRAFERSAKDGRDLVIAGERNQGQVAVRRDAGPADRRRVQAGRFPRV